MKYVIKFLSEKYGSTSSEILSEYWTNKIHFSKWFIDKSPNSEKHVDCLTVLDKDSLVNEPFPETALVYNFGDKVLVLFQDVVPSSEFNMRPKEEVIEKLELDKKLILKFSKTMDIEEVIKVTDFPDPFSFKYNSVTFGKESVSLICNRTTHISGLNESSFYSPKYYYVIDDKKKSDEIWKMAVKEVEDAKSSSYVSTEWWKSGSAPNDPLNVLISNLKSLIERLKL